MEACAAEKTYFYVPCAVLDCVRVMWMRSSDPQQRCAAVQNNVIKGH